MSRLFSRKCASLAALAVAVTIVFAPAVRAQAFGGSSYESGCEHLFGQSRPSKMIANEADVDVLMRATEDILYKSFEDNYRIEREGNFVTISIWSEGVANASVYAAKDLGYKRDWNALLKSLQGMSDKIYSTYEPYGLDVSINVLNDLNRDKVLISYMNSVLVYDTTSAVDI